MTSPRQNRRRPVARRGFTIIELLIVIGIILAIGGLVLVNVSGANDKADVRLARVQIQAFNSALEQFKLDMKRFPSEEEGLAVLWNKELVEDEDEAGKWQGPYLKKPAVKDTWGSEWVYRNPSEIEGVAYDIVSLGPDQEEGTDDDITSNDGMVGEDGETLDEFSDFTSTGG
jgi:general secretion pathway protein G